MYDNVTGMSIYLLPGMSVKLNIPIKAYNLQGWFVRTEALPKDYWGAGSKASLIPLRGFVVENPEVGEIKKDPDIEGPSVIYTHKKAMPNAIWFFARTGERGLVSVISVPIHDHSNIMQGGPAFGTYFNDDSTGG